MEPTTRPRYRAFISYSAADRTLGERFQRAVEHYRIPRPLRGVDHGHGSVPTRLTPLFRDRSDADASVSLAATLRRALEDSQALIVLCSPNSARSRWVNEEIRTFKSLGRASRIFPVLIAGTPRRFDEAHSPEGAFPPALFERVAPDGSVLAGDDPEPLAPDLRDTGDGFDLAKLKVVAALTGISLTVLTARQREAERRERALIVGVAAAMFVLAVAASVSAVAAWRSADEARARLADAIEIAERRVDDAARFHDTFGVPIAVIRELLQNAESDFESLAAVGESPAPALQLARGRMLVHLSGLYREVGDTERQLALAREGRDALERVQLSRVLYRPATWFARLPSEDAVLQEKLGAIEALGIAFSDMGRDDDEAEKTFERGRELAQQNGRHAFAARFWALIGEQRYLRGDIGGALAASDSSISELMAAGSEDDSVDRAVELAQARGDRAELLLESERHKEALTQQAVVVDDMERRAQARPDDVALARTLGHAVTRLADITYAVTGDWTVSIPILERAVTTFERVYQADRARVDHARDLSVVLERLGDARLQLGNIDGAATDFERVIVLREERLARDPENAEAARDVAVALERRADVALAKGMPERALAALDRARELRLSTLADAANPDAVESRDLAVLWSKTGTARRALARGGTWAEAFDKAISLMSPLVEGSEAPAGWLRDLAVFHASYGDALERSGRKSEARAQLSAALQLVDRQLAINADDPRLQQDRRMLRARLGMSL